MKLPKNMNDPKSDHSVVYTYMSCTNCAYDCVLAIRPAENQRVFCCSICFDLTGVMIDLVARPATENDVPNGVDQRTGEPR